MSVVKERFPIDGPFQPRECAGCGRVSKFSAASKTPPLAGSRGLHVRSSYRSRARQMSVFRNIKSKSVGYDRRPHTPGYRPGSLLASIGLKPPQRFIDELLTDREMACCFAIEPWRQPIRSLMWASLFIDTSHKVGKEARHLCSLLVPFFSRAQVHVVVLGE
jgi:hypothetical protein